MTPPSIRIVQIIFFTAVTTLTFIVTLSSETYKGWLYDDKPLKNVWIVIKLTRNGRNKFFAGFCNLNFYWTADVLTYIVHGLYDMYYWNVSMLLCKNYYLDTRTKDGCDSLFYYSTNSNKFNYHYEKVFFHPRSRAQRGSVVVINL